MVNTYCDNSERTVIESCTKKNKGKEGIEEFCPETGVLKEKMMAVSKRWNL